MINIPFDNADLNTSVSQDVILDGVTYTFAFEYLDALDVWTLSIYVKDGAPVVQGLHLFCGLPLLHSVVAPNTPKGSLFVWRFDGSVKAPGLADFGTVAKLWYLAEGETL
jgi:hypothetical protein